MPDPLPPLPEPFVERLRRDLGRADADALIDALGREPARGLRVNPERLDLETLGAATGWALEPLAWSPDGARVLDTGGDAPGKHPLHEAGAYYLQDPSAMAVAEALRAPLADLEDPWVIDLAAAPGGKATHLAGLLGDRGVLVANDVHTARVTELGRNLERWGARNSVVTNAAPAALAAAWGARFDAVLLDAPCSGEGMFRKSADARAMWSDAAVAACALRQRDLLTDAVALLAPGGRLVYSTCTFAPDEDEGIVVDALTRFPELALEALELPGTDRGRAAFAPQGTPSAVAASLDGTARLWPHRQSGEGHFVARFVKLGDAAPGTLHRPRGTPEAPATRTDRELWSGFVADALAADPVAGWALERRGELLIALPSGPPAGGVPTLRRGLHLGRIRSGKRRGVPRFEPGHALAHALRSAEIGRRLELAPSDPRLSAYLTGLELEAPGDDGWLVVTVLGCPLGWGRRKAARLRNGFPKGLRWR